MLGQQLGDVPGQLYLRRHQDDQVIADPLQVGDEVGGEHHGDPRFGDHLHEHLEEVASGQWIQAGHRLVEEEEIGALGDGQRERQLGPLAPGQGSHPLARVEIEPLDAGGRRPRIPAGVHRGPHREVLSHGQSGVGGRVLGDESDTRQLPRVGGRGATEHGDGALRRGQQPDGQLQEGGLPGAVGPDKTDDSPFGNGEGAVPQRPAASIPLAQSLGLQDGGHATPSANALRKVVR